MSFNVLITKTRKKITLFFEDINQRIVLFLFTSQNSKNLISFINYNSK